MARIEYEVIESWEKLPEGWNFVEVAGGGDGLEGTGSTPSTAASIR